MSSPINKAFVSFILLFVFCFVSGLLLRQNPDVINYLSSLPLLALLFFNSISLYLGLPLSSVFDILIFTKIGFNYLYIAPLFVSSISFMQVISIRFFYSFFKISSLRRSAESLMSQHSFINRPILFTFLLRTIPLAPFIVSSFIISNFYSLRLSTIFLISLLGITIYYSYFYFFFVLGSII